MCFSRRSTLRSSFASPFTGLSATFVNPDCPHTSRMCAWCLIASYSPADMEKGAFVSLSSRISHVAANATPQANLIHKSSQVKLPGEQIALGWIRCVCMCGFPAPLSFVDYCTTGSLQCCSGARVWVLVARAGAYSTGNLFTLAHFGAVNVVCGIPLAFPLGHTLLPRLFSQRLHHCQVCPPRYVRSHTHTSVPS